MLGALVACACLAVAGCENFLAPDRQTPEDSGTVSVQVRDTGGRAVADIRVCVELRGDEPYVGRVCGPTRSDGTFTAYYVESGRRTVECSPPTGYVAEGADLVREVDVTKGSRVEVAFVLSRI
jgi:hypothetical protein